MVKPHMTSNKNTTSKTKSAVAIAAATAMTGACFPVPAFAAPQAIEQEVTTEEIETSLLDNTDTVLDEGEETIVENGNNEDENDNESGSKENSTSKQNDAIKTNENEENQEGENVSEQSDAVEVSTYDELVSAIAAATEGDTIDIVSDIIAPDVVIINKDLTINGNGHSIATTANRVVRIAEKANTVTINDLKMYGNRALSSDGRGVSIDGEAGGSTLTLNGCYVSASHYAINVLGTASNVNISIIDTTLDGWACLNIWGNDGTYTIKDSTLISTNDKSESAYNNFSAIKFAGDSSDSANNNKMTIDNTTVERSSNTSNMQVVFWSSRGATGNTVTTDENCKFTYPDVFAINSNGDGSTSDQDGSTNGEAGNKITVRGGTFSTDVAPFAASGLRSVEQSDGTFAVQEASAENSVASTTTPSGTIEFYDSLSAAVAAATEDGSTVTLYRDMESNLQIKPTAGITIDLGGHTVTNTYTGTAFMNLSKHGIVVKNGTIVNNVTTSKVQTTANVAFEDIAYEGKSTGFVIVANKATFDNCSLNMQFSDNSTASAILAGHKSYAGRASVSMSATQIRNTTGTEYAGNGITAQYGATVNMDKSCYIEMDSGAGVTVYDDSVANIAGTIHSGDYFAVTTHGAVGQNPTINIADGTKITAVGNGAAIYLPAPEGKTVIGKAEISGQDGVQLRGGELIVNGAEITATVPAFIDPSGNADGSVNTGAAVSVIPHTHGVAPKLVINDGVLMGPVALYEADVQGVGTDVTDTMELSIGNGTFISTVGDSPVVSDDKNEFISGGNYSNPKMAEYVIPGKVVIDDGDVADAPFILDEEQPANDRSAGYIVIGDTRVYYTTPDALAKAAEKFGTEAVASTRTVTFVDRHGNTLKTVTVDYGEGVPADEIPQLSEDELTYVDAQGRTHEFTGWSVPPTGAFTEDTEIVPTYGEKLVYSTITFKNGLTGEVIAEVSAPNAYELSDSLIPNPEPTIEVDGKTYKFAGWDAEPDGFMVDGDKAFIANYELDAGESGDKDPSKPETPETPADGEGGDDSDNEGTVTGDGENIDDDDNTLGNGENIGNSNENIQDDENALCAPDENEKALHQTGDFLPYVIASAIAAAVIGLIALIRRKMSE